MQQSAMFLSIGKSMYMRIHDHSNMKYFTQFSAVHTPFQIHTLIHAKYYTISKIMHAMWYIFIRLDRRWKHSPEYMTQHGWKKNSPDISTSIVRNIFSIISQRCSYFSGVASVEVSYAGSCTKTCWTNGFWSIGWSVFMLFGHNAGIMLLSSQLPLFFSLQWKLAFARVRTL